MEEIPLLSFQSINSEEVEKVDSFSENERVQDVPDSWKSRYRKKQSEIVEPGVLNFISGKFEVSMFLPMNS